MCRSGSKEGIWLLAVMVSMCASAKAAEGEKKGKPIQELVLEIKALETLYALTPTVSQLETLKKLAKDTGSKVPENEKLKLSGKLRKTLDELHAALVDATDNERIDQLSEQMEKLRDEEKVAWPEEYELTEEAQQKAAEAVRTFSARQIVVYLAQMAEDITDPFEQLKEAVHEVRGLSAEKWKEYREEVPPQIAQCAAGLDADKKQQISDQITQLLIVVRSLKEQEFKTQIADLEKKIRQILGDIGPTDVLRHVLESNFSELLANPGLPATINARLKKMGKG